jgi:DEAD/DEAH box helicase domain-containing protein
LFRGLKYVVLDELHTYRGVFGSHMAHVLARLQRIATFHGATPQFLCATATIGNPLQHAARLIGCEEERVALVNESGAPTASRQVFVYNPPIVDATLQLRGSALKHAVDLTADLVEAKVPTIVFAQSRNSVEIFLKYLRQRCAHVAGPDALMAYRGGYLPETRRSIERGLRDGEILCVVATNALELGIDIGDLEAAVCVGYPGSIASMWQRFGRAGRRGSQSIALLVCASHSIDQFLAREPGYLLNTSAEEARIDPDNPEILIQHLKCAVFEAPFLMTPSGHKPGHPERAEGEHYASLDAAGTREALEYLQKQQLVHSRGGRFYWAGDAYPASHISLRNIGWDNFVIIDVTTEKTLAELDWRATHTMLHEQAIYQHDAEQYQVERLDYDNHKAYVRKVAPDYFTTALTYRDVEVIEEFQRTRLHPRSEVEIGFGEVKVVEKVTGYKKIKFFTHENAGYGDVHLPEMQMHTTSFWLSLPESAVQRLGADRTWVIDGLRGLGRAFETVATLALMCDPQDLNRTLGDGYDDAPATVTPTPEGSATKLPGRNSDKRGQHSPTLFVFDAHAGGVGLSERIFARALTLLERTERLIHTCPCAFGCPACVGPTDGGGRKTMALQILAECK